MNDYLHAMNKARGAADLARTHLLSVIDKTERVWMHNVQSEESKKLVAIINQNDSALFYAAARQYRAESME